jgi:hypothetical protein
VYFVVSVFVDFRAPSLLMVKTHLEATDQLMLEGAETWPEVRSVRSVVWVGQASRLKMVGVRHLRSSSSESPCMSESLEAALQGYRGQLFRRLVRGACPGALQLTSGARLAFLGLTHTVCCGAVRAAHARRLATDGSSPASVSISSLCLLVAAPVHQSRKTPL